MTIRMRAPLEVGVAVIDMERAVRFYETALGFTRMSEATLTPDRARQAGFGEVAFRLVRMQTNWGERIKLIATDPPPHRTDPDILGETGIRYLTFIVDDLDAALERLRVAGARLVTEAAVQTRPGTRLAFFRDSEGNALELCEYADLAAYRPDLAAASTPTSSTNTNTTTTTTRDKP